jgi:hypothetical protein
MHAFAEWLEATSLAVLVRESAYGFAITVGIHIIGLTLSLGVMLWFDLRLLGLVWRETSVSVVYRRLIPWAGTGFAVMFTTGAMLFTGYATSAIDNTAFRVKMLALVVAAVNALVYHRYTARIATWDTQATPPRGARIAGVVSLVAWGTVLFAGRIISYTMF